MTNGTGQEIRSDDDIIAFFFSDYAKALRELLARVDELPEEIRRRGLSETSEERYSIQRLEDSVHEIAKVIFSV